jgi:regulator of sirC expression with transglutaminase-like and TPR domain
LHPELQIARYLRGILYWRELHRYPAAITDLTLVLDSFSDAIFIRGMAYQALGDYEQAVQDLETFLQTAPTSRYAANAERQLRLLQAIVAELPRQLPDGSSPLLKG